jgi:hypothetical protein
MERRNVRSLALLVGGSLMASSLQHADAQMGSSPHMAYAALYQKAPVAEGPKAEEQVKPESETRQPEYQPPATSAAVEPLNPFANKNIPKNQLLHLEYFRYVPEKQEESETDYLRFLRKERQDRKNMSHYSEPLTGIESWMKAGISLYSVHYEGYPYRIVIKKGDVELKRYEGVINRKGQIDRLNDIGVYAFDTSFTKKDTDQQKITIEANIFGAESPAEIVASDKREIIVN